MSYGPPPGFTPPPYGYGPPPGAPIPPYPMNPMGGMPPPMHQGNNSLAIASFVTGILSVVPGCCCSPLGMTLAVMAGVMGFVGLNQIKQSQNMQGGKGLAIAGLVCAGSSLALHVVNLGFSISNSMMKGFHF